MADTIDTAMESSGSTAVDSAANISFADASQSKSENDDVKKKFTGPLQEFVLSAIEILQEAPATDNSVMRSVCADLVMSYSSLDEVDRQTVDKQLVDILYELTTRGLDVNAICDDERRQTPLHVIASVSESSRFIRALHAAGAKMNAVDRNQQTALHIATKNGDSNNVVTLIDCGANVNQPDSNKQSPLHIAARGRRQAAVMKALIRGRADVRQVDSGGHTALHIAVTAGRPELVRELIVHGKASINKRDVAGMTAVHLAAIHDISGAVLTELLRHKSSDVNARDTVTMETPLHKAVRFNMVDCIQLLLRHGADPNIANSAGETPLHLAAACLTDLATWNILIGGSGGKVDAETASGLTVRDAAAEANNSIAKAVIAQFDAMTDLV